MSSPVLLEVTENVALLTVNRSEKLNALNYEVVDLVTALLDKIEDDDDVRAVILIA